MNFSGITFDMATSKTDKLKKCCKCKQHLPCYEFNKASSKSDGLQTACRSCHRSRYLKSEEQKEKMRSKQKAWRRNNKQQSIDTLLRWKANNPDKVKAAEKDRVLNRRAKIAQNFVENVSRTKVFNRDKGICGICNTAVDVNDFHVDHITPVSKGGEHSYANCQLAHPSCNYKKSASL